MMLTLIAIFGSPIAILGLFLRFIVTLRDASRERLPRLRPTIRGWIVLTLILSVDFALNMAFFPHGAAGVCVLDMVVIAVPLLMRIFVPMTWLELCVAVFCLWSGLLCSGLVIGLQ